MVSMEDDPIALVPSRYEEWREQFERERDRVIDVLELHDLSERVRRIEHVGSTAVPGLSAKDIVDVDVVVEDGSVKEVARVLETELGGTRYDNTVGWNPVAREVDGQRFNDHVFAVSDDGWKVSVVTAAVLRARPTLRDEYEQLKREHASETDDLETYSRSKSAFIAELLAVAQEQEDFEFEFAIPTPR